MVKDFLGREIQPGMTLVYPVTSGSSPHLKKILVQEVNEQPTLIRGLNDLGRKVVVRRADNAVVIT